MKEPTCRAILTTHGGSSAAPRPGQRCPEVAIEPEGLPQLCWVHAKAMTNPDRAKPLELVAMSLRERERLEQWQAARLAKAAGK
ncbi:MAG TPA: hypothetical protein VNO55_31680 [Polyangia bacterium]|nr:hypothetical protein [Polyangia bacterium]